VKAVIDTNVLVSALISKGSPYKILVAWRNKEFTLILTPEIYIEYVRILEEFSKKATINIENFLDYISSNSEMVESVPLEHAICSDPDDDKFIEAALAANARFIVSGDKALLKVSRLWDIEIVTPAQFLNVLK